MSPNRPSYKLRSTLPVVVFGVADAKIPAREQRAAVIFVAVQLSWHGSGVGGVVGGTGVGADLGRRISRLGVEVDLAFRGWADGDIVAGIVRVPFLPLLITDESDDAGRRRGVTLIREPFLGPVSDPRHVVEILHTQLAIECVVDGVARVGRSQGRGDVTEEDLRNGRCSRGGWGVQDSKAQP